MTQVRQHLRLVKTPTKKRAAFTVAPYHSPPFRVQGLILEEDTWFALSTPPRVRQPRSHPFRVLTEAWEAEPVPPGSVHIRGSNPFRILAVVHDLGRDPTWRLDWVEQALRRSLAAAREQGLEAVGIEPLGSVHGRLPTEDFDILLERVVTCAAAPPLRVWRIEPAD